MEKESTKAVKLPRGLRNNNPLNIRITPAQRNGFKDRWLGMCKEQTDKAFCQFTEMKYGWRAAFLLLTRNYYHVHHLYTPKDIIMRWAPPSENNTEAYIKFVCDKAGLQPDQYLGVPSSAEGLTWMKLALAMAIMENGVECLDYFAMMDGWMLARDYAQRNVASVKNR